MAKHVTQHSIVIDEHNEDMLTCEHCHDVLSIVGDPPLWMQLAIKDAFVSMHAACTIEDEQKEPTVEVLRYERAD